MSDFVKTALLSFATALCMSAFIYLEHYGLSSKLINTLLGLAAFALILHIPKRAILGSGFLIGLFWFYWIGYSFEYQGVGFMTPIITVAFGFVYLLFFLPLYFTPKAYVRALLLFALSFVEPFDWNWMRLELPFVESYIGIEKWQFALVLLALSLPSLLHKKIQNRWRFASLLLLLFSLDLTTPQHKEAPLKIKLVATDVKQEHKWQKESLEPTLEMIFNEILKAKIENYDLILFPESVFPLFLNKAPQLMEALQKASQEIAIVTGALYLEDGKHYNATYFFDKGNYKVAKKVVLVPFGEYIPLPAFAKDFINDTFFSGGSDFVNAESPSDFLIKGVKFRNAICYEATCDELYKGDVVFMLAMSNNAWFAPSIEPTLQNLLLRFYARKYGVTIYHAANYKGSGVIW